MTSELGWGCAGSDCDDRPALRHAPAPLGVWYAGEEGGVPGEVGRSPPGLLFVGWSCTDHCNPQQRMTGVVVDVVVEAEDADDGCSCDLLLGDVEVVVAVEK